LGGAGLAALILAALGVGYFDFIETVANRPSILFQTG
tara:strand:- start:220 stop:330 length:111 start_codon:yes stop_codon:yes gene_type:complete